MNDRPDREAGAAHRWRALALFTAPFLAAALSATILGRHAQVRHARLGEFVSSFSFATQMRLADTDRFLSGASGLDPASVKSPSVGLVAGALQRQAVVRVFLLSRRDGKGPAGH